MKKIILIDLDRTLIDTDRLISHRHKILKEFGISKHSSHVAYKKTIKSSGFYHPIRHLHHLTKEAKTRKLIFKKFDLLFLKEKEHNYVGAFEFLKKLSAKYNLILLSHGHKKFQLTKVGQTKMGPFFEKIIVTKEGSKGKELKYFFKKYGKNALLLDDSAEAINSARAIGLRSIKVKKARKNSPYYRKLLNRITDIMSS